MWIDDDRQKSRRVGSSSLSEASASGEWVRLPTPSDDVAVAPGGGTVDVVSNVAQDRILGRVSSGSGDSEELTAAQVRTFLGDPWVTITDTTLGSAAASFEVDTTGYSVIEVVMRGQSDLTGAASSAVRARLNGDTGNNYHINTGVATSAWNNNGTLPALQTNTDRLGMWEAKIALGGVGSYTTGNWKSSTWSSTATAGTAIQLGTFFYVNTAAAITSMSIYPSSGNWAAGTRLLVRGRA
jgi:hypothetical protein